MKFLRDVREHEHHQEEVEGIEGPPQVSREHHVFLTSVPRHCVSPSASILAGAGRHCRPAGADPPRPLLLLSFAPRLEWLMQGRFEKRGGIGIIWIDNPPVNAISVGVRVAIIDGVRKLAEGPELVAGVLACEGRTFMAGADITEFGQLPKSPSLHDPIQAVDGSSKPIVA